MPLFTRRSQISGDFSADETVLTVGIEVGKLSLAYRSHVSSFRPCHFNFDRVKRYDIQVFACHTRSWNVLDYLLMHVESIKVETIGPLFSYLNSVKWRDIFTIISKTLSRWVQARFNPNKANGGRTRGQPGRRDGWLRVPAGYMSTINLSMQFVNVKLSPTISSCFAVLYHSMNWYFVVFAHSLHWQENTDQ